MAWLHCGHMSGLCRADAASASASRAARICCAANPWTRCARQDVEGSTGGDAGEQVGLGVRFALGAQSDRFSCKAFHVGAQFLTQNIV